MLDYRSENITLLYGDCLERMKEVEDRSVELILCDLPYGTTSCAWDSVIDIDAMWAQYKRIVTATGAIVLTAAQPFTSVLAASNLPWFKYEWIWVKNRPTNFAHAKNKPMKKHENILVFSPGTTVHKTQSKMRMTYNPQGVFDIASKKVTKRASEKTDAFFADRPGHGEFERKQSGFPHSLLEYSTDQLGLHPTAKPIELFRYLVRTYSNEGERVMDNCLGSGTTGIAAVMENRRFVGMEQDEKYFNMSRDRILAAALPSGDEPIFDTLID
jgi:site-specific DNA-methyltransferase (adenine-specific)